MKYILFGDKSLDALVAAILTFYKCVYDGVSNVVVSSIKSTDPLPLLLRGDSLVLLGVPISKGHIDHLTNDIGVNLIVVNYHDEFIKENSYPFLDWHNLTYFFLSENLDNDIFDKLDVLKQPVKTGWGLYFSDNKAENRTDCAKRSVCGIVHDVLLDKDPSIESFLKTFMGEDYRRLIEYTQENELGLHKGNQLANSYVLSQWYKNWENENLETYIKMKENMDHRNQYFDELRSSFFKIKLNEKLTFGREWLMKNRIKTRELAMSKAVHKAEFYKYKIKDLKVCYVDSPLIPVIGGCVVGNGLVKEHGWDIAILDYVRTPNKKTYFLYSNPNGADIDVLDLCRFYYEQGLGEMKTGKRNVAVVEFDVGDEKSFFTIL